MSLYEYEATVLRLNEIGVSPFSARGITQTIEPIAASANMWRTINGGLLDESGPQFRKFRTSIVCRDQNPPALDGVWPGMQLTVHCLETQSYKTIGGSPSRPVVPGSLRTEGEYTIYRPIIVIRVFTFRIDVDEWGAEIGWTLEGEEI